MEIMCPSCGVVLELPEDNENHHFLCSECNHKFIVNGGIASPLPYASSHPAAPKPPPAPTKIPGVTLAAFVIMYIYCGFSFLGNLGNLPASSSASAIVLLVPLCSFTICAHHGFNWARITLTSLIGLMMLPLLFIGPVAFLIVAAIFSIPIVFLWLPRSNEWFREMKRKRNEAFRK